MNYLIAQAVLIAIVWLGASRTRRRATWEIENENWSNANIAWLRSMH